MQLPVTVRWVAKTGTGVEEATETDAVSAHGCMVHVRGAVFDGLPLEVENRSIQARRKGRVAYCCPIGPDGRTPVAVEFDEADPNFWGPSYAAVAGAPISLGEAVTSREERRRYTRHKCEGRAGLVVAGTDVETAGMLSDVSQGGCYVETMSPLSVGTSVRATLEVREIRIEAEAVVCASHPVIGMGLRFVQLDEENEARLQRLLAELGEGSTPAAAAADSFPLGPGPPKLGETPVLLEALVQILESKGVLTRKELLETIEKTKTSSKS